MRQLRVGMIALGVVITGLAAPGEAAARVRVVATLPTFANLVKTVGGDEVDVSAVASAKFNPHFIEPKPSDVLKVKRADLFVHAGLDLEAWRAPLVDAAGNVRIMPGQPGELDLSEGVPLLEVPNRAVSRSEGDIHLYGNPHYWVDPRNAMIMVRQIADKLGTLDPAHAEAYHSRAEAFVVLLQAKITDWQARLVPFHGRELVGHHNEWPYLVQFAGLTMTQFLEPKPGIPPTPKQLQFIEDYVKARRIRVVARSAHDAATAAETVAKRTGAQVVVLYQSVGEAEGLTDYPAVLERNVQALIDALASSGGVNSGGAS